MFVFAFIIVLFGAGSCMIDVFVCQYLFHLHFLTIGGSIHFSREHVWIAVNFPGPFMSFLFSLIK